MTRVSTARIEAGPLDDLGRYRLTFLAGLIPRTGETIITPDEVAWTVAEVVWQPSEERGQPPALSLVLRPRP